MAKYPMIAAAHWYDEITNSNKVSYHPLYASTLAKATAMIEKFYGETLESVEIFHIDGENILFEITKDQAVRCRREGAYLFDT